MDNACGLPANRERLEAIATVVRLEKAHAIVVAERANACGSCAASTGCATGSWARAAGNPVNTLRARNPCGARIGERVVIGLPAAVVLRGSLHIYAAPLAGLLAGALVAAFLGAADGLVALGSLAGLGLGFAYAARSAGRQAGGGDFEPVILRRVTEAGASAASLPNDLAA